MVVWGAGTCSDATYSFEYTCVAAGICSDPVYNDDETGCIDSGGSCSDGVSTSSGACYENDGTCTDATLTNNTDCTAAGETWTATNIWTPINTYTNSGNTWTSAGNVWTPGDAGYCSDGIQTTQEVCEGPRGTWVIEEFEHCDTTIAGITIDNQIDCEAPRGVWDNTTVTEMDGQWVEIVGDGIDLDFVVTLGDVVQTETESLNLPYKIRFEIHPDTLLGDNELRVTNADLDTSAFSDPFVVTDTLHIRTVTDNNDGSYGVTGAAFIAADTIIEIIDAYSQVVVDTPAAVVNTPTDLVFVIGSVVAGTYNVKVTNLDGQTFTEVLAVIIT